jgi:hypothetical protein
MARGRKGKTGRQLVLELQALRGRLLLGLPAARQPLEPTAVSGEHSGPVSGGGGAGALVRCGTGRPLLQLLLP